MRMNVCMYVRELNGFVGICIKNGILELKAYFKYLLSYLTH